MFTIWANHYGLLIHTGEAGWGCVCTQIWCKTSCPKTHAGTRKKTQDRNQGLCFSMIEISPQSIDKLTPSEEVKSVSKGLPKRDKSHSQIYLKSLSVQ